jgi:hypothetical protein
VIANTVIDLDGDSAVARSYLVFSKTDARGSAFVLTARYTDELRLVGGFWQIARREIHPEAPS